MRHTDTYSAHHQQSRLQSSSSSAPPLQRCLTCVYYLNADWQPRDGGALRVFVEGDAAATGPPQPHWDIAPTLDKLVVFRSTDVPHEVLPTFADRMALTVWYYAPVAPSAVSLLPLLPSSNANCNRKDTNETTKDDNDDQDSDENTIFVSIPSYCDSECLPTVRDLLRKARRPGRVHVGVFLQSATPDADAHELLEGVAREHRDRVRVQYVHVRDAAGPCVARQAAQTLYQGETFYLQIDSHMRWA